MLAHCRARGINPGLALRRERLEGLEDCLLVAITEQRTREHIDRLAETLEEAIDLARTEGTPGRLAEVG